MANSDAPMAIESVTVEAALRAVGFDHGAFNVELFCDPAGGMPRVIEINPRLAAQFGDLYEAVDGTHPYVVLTDLALGRTLDTEGKVTGAGLYASKIGGPVEGAVMLIPDPMGATGSTVSRVLRHYRAEVQGAPHRVVAVHLIVTPEYLRHVTQHHPEVQVWALRLDRGLSDPEVLATVPGTHWERERGLTSHDYIVPGGGGLGEVINNSFV